MFLPQEKVTYEKQDWKLFSLQDDEKIDMTCTWLEHDLNMTWTWLEHDLHMPCTWLPNLNPFLRDCPIEKVEIGDKKTTTRQKQQQTQELETIPHRLKTLNVQRL